MQQLYELKQTTADNSESLRALARYGERENAQNVKENINRELEPKQALKQTPARNVCYINRKKLLSKAFNSSLVRFVNEKKKKKIPESITYFPLLLVPKNIN